MQDDLTSQPLHSAHALPARWYVDPAMTGRDRTAVFDRAWHLVAHLSQLQAAGDHVVADLAARCDGLGAKSLRCAYHGWTYALDGAMKSAPEMAGADGFDIARIRLPQLQVHTLQGLVFACAVDSGTPAFNALVEGIDARLGDHAMLSKYGHHQRIGYDIACSWKVYVDNFLEGYHLPHAHPALNRMLDYRS